MQKMRFSLFFSLAAVIPSTLACESCNGAREVVHERNVRRMQPGSTPAKSGPRGPLEWGQLNFLQTVSCSSSEHSLELETDSF